MREFSLLVKPAGSACNLACPYCFYRGHGEVAPMSDAVLERMLTTYRALPIAQHTVAFQGGEPLIMGERFFRRAAKLGDGIDFSVQTNATLVTESLAAFFAEKDWLVGVSPHWRRSVPRCVSPAAGKGGLESAAGETHRGTESGLAGYRTLVAAGTPVNVLQLITAENVHEPEALYHYIRDELGCKWHQYIECTDPKPYAITGEQWGEFLCRLFDEWRKEGDEHTVSVRLFDSVVSQLVRGVPTMCNFASDCRNYLVVERNGDVYPCDFHVIPELKLGNVMTHTWEELLDSPVYANFGLRKRQFPDCPRNRGTLDVGWQRFFAHAVPYLKTLIR